MNRELAIQEFLKASALMEQKDYQNALEIFYGLIPALSDVPALHYNIAQIQMKLDQWSSALEHIDLAITLEAKVSYRVAKFQLLQQVSRYDQAITLAREILADEIVPSVAQNLAFLYLRQDDVAPAVELLDDLRALNYLNPRFLFSLGVLKYQSKLDSEAEEILTEAINAGYSSWDAIQVLVASMERQNKLKEAIDFLLSLETTEKSQFVLARLYKGLGHAGRSRTIMLELLAKDRSIEYLTFHGHLLREEGEYEDALDIYNEVVERDENNLAAIKGSALSMMELGRHEEANALFEQGEKISRGGNLPDFDNMLLNLDVLEGTSEGLFGKDSEE
ncbi:MAG: tetratricopeptide repeat protein [Candidatus Kariarchaeaceae archaeon]|jgi:tetratricopeptide (TPR) repeat protein